MQRLTRKQLPRRSRLQTRSRRGGFTIVYAALTLSLLLGLAAMVVDYGFDYKRKADAQKAADAAALAGAYILSQGGSCGTVANAKTGVTSCNGTTITLKGATAIAQANGYDRNTDTISYPTPACGTSCNQFRVMVSRDEPQIFSGIFGVKKRTINAVATAIYTVLVNVPINSIYYGTNDGPTAFSCFGPDGYFANGDAYSVTKDATGNANANYNANGYNFSLNVPSNWATKNAKLANGTTNNPYPNIVQVEIFDPDCYNANSGTEPATDSNGNWTAIDEMRTSGGGTGSSSNATTTRYTLYYDNGTPNDTTDDIQLGQNSYGNTSTTDMKWITPSSNWKIDVTDSRFQHDDSGALVGNFRVNVKSTAGSSENGYNLRAGPYHTVDSNNASTVSESTWHTNYGGVSGTTGANVNGTTMAAEGHLPLNFNINGTADILLGYVPSTAAGGQFFVNKFDTDVGAQGVYYTCDSLPGQTFSGTLAAGGQFKQDTITLPSGYTGGNWHAFYTAGADDTSSWSISYSQGNGSPGGIRLIE